MAFLTAPTTHTYTGNGKTLTMENLPVNDVFPYGQKMFIGAYGCTGQETNAGNAGFTVAGADYDMRSPPSVSEDYAARNSRNAKNNGMKYVVLLRRAHVSYGGVSDVRTNFNSWMATSTQRTEAKRRVRSEMTRLDNLVDSSGNKFHDNLYGYIYGLDDYRTQSGSNNTSYQNEIYREITAHSKTLYGSNNARSVGESGFSWTYRSSWAYDDYLVAMDNTQAQSYFGGGDRRDDGDGLWYSRYSHYKNANRAKVASERLDNTPNGKPRLLTTLFHSPGYAYSCVPGQGESGDNRQTFRNYITMETLHDNVVSLLGGQNGLWWYQLYSGYTGVPTSSDYRSDARSGLYKGINILTKSEASQALLWGKKKTDITLTSVTSSSNRKYAGRASGTKICNGSNAPCGSSWRPGDDELMPNDGRHTYTETDMLSWTNVQYKKVRYIIAVNSMPTEAVTTYWNGINNCVDSHNGDTTISNVPDPKNGTKGKFTVRFNGIPTIGVIITEMVGTASNSFSPTNVPLTGNIQVQLKPLQVVIYKIEDIPEPTIISKVKISGTWRAIKSSQVKVSGTWRDIKSTKVKINGIWKASTLGIPPVAPTVSTAANKTITVGQTATFTATVTGDRDSMKWQYRTSSTASWAWTADTDTSHSVATTNTAKNGYQYRLTATNAGLIGYGGAGTLTVNPIVTELIINGTFPVNTSGWTAYNSTLSVNNGELKVVNTKASQGVARQTITVVPGKTYTLKWRHGLEGGNSTQIKIGSSAYGGDDIYNKWSDGRYYVGTTYTATISSSTTKMYVQMHVSSGSIGGYTHYDNISIK